MLFRMEGKMNEEFWNDYVIYVDDIVLKDMQLTVGVSIAYLAENMDPNNNNPALFESRLELNVPNLIFVPSLDSDDKNSFNRMLICLVDDILHMSLLIPRLLKESTEDVILTYQEIIAKDDDIKEMKQEILQSVEKVVQDAAQFCRDFERLI